MPQVPLFENDLRVPTQQMPFADPGAMAAPGEAQEQAGAQFGDAMQAWNAQYVQAKRQANAAGLLDQGLSALGDAQFAMSKVPDHQQAYTGFQQQAAKIRQGLMAQTSDPEIQSYVGRAFDQEAIMRGLDTRNAAFALESSTQVGALQQRLVNYQNQIATAGSPLERAHLTDIAHQDIAGSVAGHWIAPEGASLLTIKFNSDAAEAQARGLAARDPVTAEQILNDPAATQRNFPGLLPAQAEMLAYQVGWRAQRVEAQNIAAQEHADAVAERNVVRTQSANEMTLLEGIYSGKIKDPKALLDLAQTRQITPAGLQAAHQALLEEGQGHDDPMTALSLLSQAATGQLTGRQVNDALAKGQLSLGTAWNLQARINAEESDAKRSEISQGAGLIDQAFSGMTAGRDVFGNAKFSAVASRAEVSAEYIRRVNAGENPLAVANDIIVREAPTLPQPVLGTITKLADIPLVWAQEQQAFHAGRISETIYDEDAIRINNIATRLKLASSAQAWRDAHGPKPPATPAATAPSEGFLGWYGSMLNRLPPSLQQGGAGSSSSAPVAGGAP